MGESENVLSQLILGVDPGTRHTGYGVLRMDGDRLTYVDHGVIRLPESWSLAKRLFTLQEELHRLYSAHMITETVVEKIFLGKNADSAFKLGHARGICLAAAARAQVPVAEYAARYVKKCVTGSGAASKDQVQLVVIHQLQLPQQKIQVDATDALALALTHGQLMSIDRRLRPVKEASL